MHEGVFAELSLILVIVASVSLVMRLIRQPLIIGYILTGIVVGPAVLHLVKSAETVEVFSSIGIALLLFVVGLGLNPQVIREVGKVSSVAGFLQVFITTGIGYASGVVLGLNSTKAIFFGAALSFSSTIIIVKLLSDKKEQSRLYGKVLTGILLIQDLIAATALLFITAQQDSTITTTNLAALVIKGSLITAPLLFIGTVILPRLHRLIAGSQEFLFLFSLGWGLGFAALFAYAGFSIEMGALLSGVSLAALPYAAEISARMRSLRDFFIVVFFIALGSRLSLGNLGFSFPLIVMGIGVVLVIKPLLVLIIMGLIGYTKRTSFKAALATAQVSEFSLVLVALGNKAKLIDNELVGIITIISLVSIAISTYLIIYSDKIFGKVDKHLESFELRHRPQQKKRGRKSYEVVLFGYRKGGHEFHNVFKKLGHPSIVVDYDPQVIEALDDKKIPYMFGDIKDTEFLDEIDLEQAKLVVSTIADFDTNKELVHTVFAENPKAIVICHANDAEQADELYGLGVSYVMLPHHIGSEKIGAFIKRYGFRKSEFRRFREKHQEYLLNHYSAETAS